MLTSVDFELPSPTPEAVDVSHRLEALIRAEIERESGWIPFSRFMELALYAPGLGYYSAGAVKIGAGPADGSDFTTAPELSPLFARAVARSLSDVLAAAGGSMLEVGAGTGRFAADALLELESLGALPAVYRILEVSADLRERQRTTLATTAPHLLDRVTWLDRWPDQVDGVVFGNEVLDALPADLVQKTATGWVQRGVTADGERALAFADRTIDATMAATLAESIPDFDDLPTGYLTERHSALDHWIGSLATRMTRRAIALFVDYGFPASEYFHPQRCAGTLMAHYRHRVVDDPLARLGLQDLTVHVDFSAVARAASRHGVSVRGYRSQSAFLIASGVGDLVGPVGRIDRTWADGARALQTLLSESEMGELFKVIALSGTPTRMRGLQGRDRSPSL